MTDGCISAGVVMNTWNIVWIKIGFVGSTMGAALINYGDCAFGDVENNQLRGEIDEKSDDDVRQSPVEQEKQ